MTDQLLPLLSAADIRALADELDLRPTKTLGQNYVIDPNTIRRIVKAAQLGEDEHVLEVGPGLGSLTLGLLDEAAAVTAVEIEPVTAARLPRTVEQFRPEASQRLSVINTDAMKVTRDELREASPVEAEPTALVANLPYNVAVPVLLHLLAELPSLKSGLVMVQQEVADRLVAEPGSKTYGVPSAKLAWYASARGAGTVGTKVFWPAPRILSGLVYFQATPPPETTATRQEVFDVIDAAFAQRRKTIRASLKNWAGTGQAVDEVLEAAGIAPQARGEVLSIDDFARIAAHRPGGQAQGSA